MAQVKFLDKRNISRSGGRYVLPPGPRLPRVAQAAAWALQPLAFMDRCQRRFGATFTLRVRRQGPWVFVTDPEHIKRVFTTPPDLMRAGAGEANPLLGPLLGAGSVMLQDEPNHMSDRRRLLPSFHGDLMASYGEMMEAVAREQIAKWPLGEPFALWPRMQAISLEVVMRAVFGDTEGPRLERLRVALVELTGWMNNPRRLALVAAGRTDMIAGSRGFKAAMRPVEKLVLEEVYERRARSPQNGKGILASLERGHAESGTVMADDKLRDELVTMLSDGPTATSLAWVFERLLAHPEKLRRLCQEVDAGAGEEYLDVVVKETLRLCPTVPVVMRKLVEPMPIDGWTIPAGTIVAPCVYLTHLREDLYPEPGEFRPERFLDGRAGTYTWIPFGGGARRCVAASFAPLEMRRVIRTVLREIELRSAETGDVSAMRSSVSFAPQSGALVIATRRPSRVPEPNVA
jgi:cytochrome P450